jgi:type I protein arginine methyltransferase
MYSIADYARMIADGPRMRAYGAALGRLVTPSSVVADIGSGTGIFALLACRLGARRVFAIEPADAIEVARSLAAANGVADRITFIQAASTEVTLDERADVVVSDIRGVLPFHGRHVPAIADARARLLAPGGALVPCQDRVWVALVETPELHAEHVAPWRGDDQGLDLGAMCDLLANSWRKARVEPPQLLTRPQCLATLDYRAIDAPHLRARETLTAMRAGVAHGVCAWFDTELTEGIGFSNAPGEPKSIYGQAWFPLDGIPLAEGQPVDVRLDAHLVGDDYVWRWAAGEGAERSTLRGTPISRSRLRKSADRHVPALAASGVLALDALAAMQEGRPLGHIARSLLERHPGAFRDWNAALGFVGDLSQRYAE